MSHKNCRLAGAEDVTAYFIMHSVEEALQNITQVAQSKPIEKRNLWAEVASIGVIAICEVSKFYVNRNLCSPINIQ